jgi:hypothetical protein
MMPAIVILGLAGIALWAVILWPGPRAACSRCQRRSGPRGCKCEAPK